MKQLLDGHCLVLPNWISLSEQTRSREKCHLKDKYMATLFICIVFEAMDGPRDYHIKHSKSDRKRQLSYDITCMWNLKKKVIQMNILKKQK